MNDKSNHTRPPWAFLAFLRWFCDPRLVEDIEGDLVERFEIRTLKKGHKTATRLFIKDVFQLFRPGIIRSFSGSQSLNQFGMLQNNIKVARRQLMRNKMYSSIKIGGFAIGIAVCLLIALFIRDELSYDRHIPDHENLYLSIKEYNNVPEYGDVRAAWFSAPFAQALREDFPEVVQTARTVNGENFGAGANSIREEGNPRNNYEEGWIFADPEIIDMFRMPMIYGDSKEALKNPLSIVLTQSVSEKLFPGENPVGKTVYASDLDERPFSIGGVVADPPKNSTLQFRVLVTLSGKEFWEGEQTFWGAQNYLVFTRIREDANLANLNSRLKEIGTKYILPLEKENGNPNAEEEVDNINFFLKPLTDIHLHAADIYIPLAKSDIEYVYIFGAIALFILGLACINFINLSTAKSANRAKEVGLRKTIGSYKSNLINQFLTESIIYSLISFALAVLLAGLILPYFNALAGKSIVLPWDTFWFIPILLVTSILIGVIAGVYPAFYLSSFRPAAVLKGTLSIGAKGSKLRNVLVVVQFTASIILIIGTFVVYQQMSFILNRQTGFDKDQVVMLEGTNQMGDQLESFKNELLNIPSVENVAIGDYLPVTGTLRNGNTWWNDGKTKEDPGFPGQNWRVDYSYIETLGMNIIEGRNFSKELRTDSAAMIINQAMARELGIADNPIGKRITNRSSNRFVYTVIGVVEDFNYDLMTEPVRPLAMRLGRSSSITSVKVNAENISATMAEIEELWMKMAPNQPFMYKFMDQQFAQMYASVQQVRDILTAFAILAVIIACLGLFGLSVFMVEQRNKEISVRLVLGAKSSQIVGMLSFNFMKPILLALLLAIPVAWYMMKEWLSDFEYQIDLGAGVFVFAGLAAIAIAMITISFQSVQAAFSNPVKGLRNE